MKKKVLAVLLGGCMVAGLLAGCGGGGDDAKTSDDGSKDSGKSGGYNFEVVVKSFQSTYWQAAKQGIDTASKELGVKCNTTGPNAESDIADQVNMLNNAINKAPDGIALAACDQSSVLKSLQTALDKKIPVVCFDTGVADAPEGSVYATVVTNNEEAGGIAAEKMYEALKDQLANAKDTVRIGEVNQDATSGNITGRGMGFINKFKELAEADGKKVAVVGNEYLQKSVRIGVLAEHKVIRLLSSSMIACLPSIRILSFCPARQTESFMRRTVMAWQKKHKKDLSPARERSITHQKL